MLKECERFMGAFDVRNFLYLFGAASGGVEGSLEKTCVTIDDLVVWGRRECRAGD